MEIVLYNDVAFKWVFGRQENILPIKSLLNAVIGFDGSETAFDKIQIVNPFDIASFPKEKNSILDIRVLDKQTNHWADVEVQVRYQSIYPERSMYYLAGLYRDQLRSGKNYENLRPCFGVHFLMADLFREKEDKDWFSHFRMLNVKTHRLLSNHWELFYIELEKFHKAFKKGKVKQSELTQWCEFILNPVDTSSPLSVQFQNNTGIQEVYAMLIQLTEDDRIREQYRLHEEWLREQRYYDNLMKKQQTDNAIIKTEKEEETRKRKAEEKKRRTAERKMKDEERKRKDEERKRKDEERKRKDEERKRKEEERKRKEVERKMQEAELKIKEEEQKRRDEELKNECFRKHAVKELRKLGLNDKQISEFLYMKER